MPRNKQPAKRHYLDFIPLAWAAMLGYLLLGLLAHGFAENATVYQLTDLDLWCIVARLV